MNNSTKTIKIIVVAILLILFSTSLRLDLNNTYPKGADTYELYTLAKNTQQTKYLTWNIDIFTTLGLSSISYPSGSILLLTSTSLLTGLDLTQTIQVWNILLILFCALLIFLISKRIFNNNLTSAILTLIYLNTRFFIAYSTFFTARNVLHVFFLGILLLLLSRPKKKEFIFIMILAAVAFITHRATILVAVFLATYFLSKLLKRFYVNKKLHKVGLLIICGAIFLAAAYVFGHSDISTETSRIPFEIGISYIDDILSILFSASMHFGILILLVPAGLIFLINKKNKSNEDFFILTTIILAVSIIVDTIYSFYLLLPIFVILIGYVLTYLINLRKTYVTVLTIALTILFIIVPLYIQVLDTQTDLTYVRPRTITLLNFLEKENITKTVACNNHVIYCSQIYALSDNITALTYTSGLTFVDKVNTLQTELYLTNVRSKLIVTDSIINTALFPNSYTSAIINWNTPHPLLVKLVDLTNLGYLIDSNNMDSIRNRARIEQKFGDTNQIYNNGLQQVKTI